MTPNIMHRESPADVRFTTDQVWQQILGVHSLSLEHETSTGVLANIKREVANFKQEFPEFQRKLATALNQLCRF